MRLKLISCFLLFLFSIVMAFPGYSTGATAPKGEKASAVIKLKKTTPLTWRSVLKKCLAKGINMIEEERNVEEDEDTSCKEVCYLMNLQYFPDLAGEGLYNTGNMEEHRLVNMRAVPYPPPNFC